MEMSLNQSRSNIPTGDLFRYKNNRSVDVSRGPNVDTERLNVYITFCYLHMVIDHNTKRISSLIVVRSNHISSGLKYTHCSEA